MAWGDELQPGGGYTWHSGTKAQPEPYLTRINPQRRAQYEAQVPNKTWSWQQPKGRGDVDRQHWVKPGPSYDDRSGYATNIPSQRGWKEDEIRGPNIPAGIATLQDDDEKMGMLGTAKQFLGGFDFPTPKVMKMAGDTAKDAMRASRLHNYYKDAAVAAGGTKAQGSRDWKVAKASMMTDKDKLFYDKHIKLAGNAPDKETKEYHLAQAETAWRNKQTSDRLSAAIGFEGYRPSKYTGVGEGSRYTGSHPLAGRRVPGYDIMQGLSEGAWGASLQDAAEAGMVEPGITGRPDWDTFDSEMVEPGIPGRPAWDTFDERYSAAPDIDFRSGIYQEGGSPSEEAMLAPPGGYLDVRDTLPEKVATHVPSWSDVWGMPGLMKEEVLEGYPGQDLEFLLNPEDYYEDLRENEEEIIPNISDLDYFNQFK